MFDKRLMEMAPAARAHIIASVLLQWAALLANIGFVFAIALVVQGILFGDAEAGWQWFIVAVGVAAIALRTAFLSLSQRQGQKGAAVAKREVRMQVYEKLAQLGPSYTESASTAEAVQVSVEGTEQLEGYFGAYVPQLFYAVLAPLTLFCFLAPLCLPAAVALLVCVPLIPLSIVAVQRIARRVMSDYWDSYTDLGETFLENLQGLVTLKIFQADGRRHAAMNEESERFRRATMRLLSMQLNSVTVMDLFAYGGAAVGIIVVAISFANGAVPLWAAFAIVLLSAEFFLPLRALGSYFHTAMGGMAVATKMYAILDAPVPKSGTRALPVKDVGISTHDLGYSYDGERQALEGVSFVAEPGTFTGIVGESGSGKSTLAAVLSGRLSGFSGSVEVAGIPLRDASPASLSTDIATVPFASYLFHGTVKSNLLMALPDATDDQLWEALRRARVDAFVREMGGLDAPILEGGSNLSGGQRQRIAIARALLRDAPVYIFDEATSNVDAESEEAIIHTINELAHEKTVIMISHRLSATANASRIYVMAGGRVAESGTHEELLAQDGAYARLWDQQAALEAIAHKAEGSGVEDAGSADASEAEEALVSENLVAQEGNREAAIGQGRSHASVMLGLLKLVKPLIGWMCLAVLLGVAGFLAAIFLTVLGVHAIIDAAGAGIGVGFTAALVLVAVCGIVRGPLRYGEQMCNHYLAFKLLALVRDKVFGALRRLAPAKLEGRRKGDLISLITSDIELLEVFYAHTLSPVLIAFIVSVIMVAFMGTMSPWFAVMSAVAYVMVGVVSPCIGSKVSGTAGRELREGIGQLNAFVLDSLRGLSEILQFGRADERKRQLSQRIAAHERVEMRLKGRSSIFTASVNGLVFALDVCMIVLAGTLALTGAVPAGAALVGITAFMSSFGPVIAVANLGTTLQQTLASGERVLQILEDEPVTKEVEGGVELREFTGAAANDVCFAYDGTAVLSDINMRIQPGQIVQIAGRSGSGKSTLCKLFLRFWDPLEGVIGISGEDLRCVNTASLRNIESCMTQDTHLFVGTLADNILIAKPDATREQLLEACRKAALDGFLAQLPKGLDTPVGELGETLSGGERQRIGLARMFLYDAPFMLLDEPTSNLDSLNEAVVLRAIKEEKGSRTVLLVSHRASTAALADEVVTIERGRIS
ncbi:MAG: thiol reductant ABC exporter subunit CydC [Eggerthellaceae bacterium]|nr:thiol reductant ABC exporter subunit CydC [Eggerthellaceae bacterium]